MSETFEASERFARATLFMLEKHTRQTRDDGKTPYAIHPLRVLGHLQRIADEKDEGVLCAALLHDTIEDTQTSFDDLVNVFGTDVAALVLEVTNDNALPKAERKAAMLAHLPALSARAKRIKLADRFDNVCDLLRGNAEPGKKARYEKETEHLLRALNGACEPLEKALGEALSELRAANAKID